MTNNTQNTNSSKLNGTANQVAGNVKNAAGKILGNEKLRSEGAAQAADGKTEKTIANVKGKIKDGIHAAGDKISKAADKIAHSRD